MASTSYTGARDHIAAAEQLEKAAQCHREAARLFESGILPRAPNRRRSRRVSKRRRNNTKAPLPRPTGNRTANRAEGETMGAPFSKGGPRRKAASLHDLRPCQVLPTTRYCIAA